MVLTKKKLLIVSISAHGIHINLLIQLIQTIFNLQVTI